MSSAGVADAPAEAGAPEASGDAGAGVSAIWIGLGSDRVYHSPTPASVAAITTIRPTSSPRDSVSRRPLSDMRGTLGPGRHRHSDNRHTLSEPPRGARSGRSTDEVHEPRGADDLLHDRSPLQRSLSSGRALGRRERLVVGDAS